MLGETLTDAAGLPFAKHDGVRQVRRCRIGLNRACRGRGSGQMLRHQAMVDSRFDEDFALGEVA